MPTASAGAGSGAGPRTGRRARPGVRTRPGAGSRPDAQLSPGTHSLAGTRSPGSVGGSRKYDLESRADEAHHESLRLWLRLLTCTLLIETEVRSRLRRDFAITLPRFDLLAQLERNPQGLKMGELSRRMMVTGGNVTGITDQLVAAGWVKRTALPDDRRAYVVKLTAAGKRAFDRIAAAHEEWVVALLGGLSANERGQLSRLLAKVKQTVNGIAAKEIPVTDGN